MSTKQRTRGPRNGKPEPENTLSAPAQHATENPTNEKYPDVSLRPRDKISRKSLERLIRQLAHSIRKLGFVNPALLPREIKVLDGCHRLAAVRHYFRETGLTVQPDHVTTAQVRTSGDPEGES